MDTHIKKFDPSTEYYFEEGCYIVETSNSPSDKEVSIARARVAPSHQTKWHALSNTTERYVILSGSGSVEIGDDAPASVSEGDVVIIPAGTRQRILNTAQVDLLFLAICSPPFRRENYQELGD